MQPIPIDQLLATAQTAQVIFLALLGVGFIILLLASSLKHNVRLLALIALVALATVILTVITHEVSIHSRPAFRLPESRSISGLTAVQWGLALDLAFAFAIIVLTGGAVVSSFSPLLFLLPTLAILLLRSESTFLFYYLAATSVAFVVAMIPFPIRYFEDLRVENNLGSKRLLLAKLKEANTIAYIVITLLCFWLSFYIGNQTQ